MILKPRPFRKPRKGHWATKNLVGCWLAGHGGNMALDLSGNGNNGTLAGDTNLVAGKFGQAWDFDGDDQITVPNSSSIQFSSPQSFTVAACILTRATGSNDGFIGNAEYEGGGYMLAVTSAADVRFMVHNNEAQYALSAGITISINVWYFVVGVYDGTNSHIYVDGLLKNSMLANISTNSSDMLIGQGQQGGWVGFNGLIDNVMILDRALSASEIALLYREPFCMFKDEPIELWAAATQSGGTPPITGIMTTNTGYWGSI